MSGYSSHIGKLMIGTALAFQGGAGSGEESEGSNARNLEAAFALYEAEKFTEAAVKLRPHAQTGNPRAQLYLATLYSTGTGVNQDEYEAAKWYGKAAGSGVAEAQFHLGLMYLEGVGVTENSDSALEWLSRASEQGFGDAIDVFNYMLNHDEVLDC